MPKVVVVGGGWAGCAASIAARKTGAEVTLLERTDSLLGTGLVGGIMRNNGRYTAAEEAIAMGCGEMFLIADSVAKHTNVDFPGHAHATLYDVARIEPVVRRFLEGQGITVLFGKRVTKAEKENARITACVTEGGERIEGDAFVDATGSAGPQANCTRFGNGCAMCALRCPSFGGRVSFSALAGISEKMGISASGRPGSMSGSCKLLKESLHPRIVEALNSTGVFVTPIPPELAKKDLSFKACQQYALDEYKENVVLLDTGHAKLMAPYFPLSSLRLIPGFEDARFVDPYAGSKGNSIRYMAIAPRDNALRVEGVDNLFCGGEKAGTLVGHTEAIVTGSLAGRNAALYAQGEELLKLPPETAIGDMIDVSGREIAAGEGLSRRYTFSGSYYFGRMKERGLYSSDPGQIHERIKRLGLEGIFGKNRFEGQELDGERR